MVALNGPDIKGRQFERRRSELESVGRDIKWRFHFCNIDYKQQYLLSAITQYHPAILHLSGDTGGLHVSLGKCDITASKFNKGDIATFLGLEKDLELVILSGCCSLEQAGDIVNAVGLAIWTDEFVFGRQGFSFFHRFYNALKGGQSYEDAFRTARRSIMTSFWEPYLLKRRTHDVSDAEPTKDRGYTIDSTNTSPVLAKRLIEKARNLPRLKSRQDGGPRDVTGAINQLIYLDINSPSILQVFSLKWGGLKTYKDCGGDFDDVLAICRVHPSENRFVADSILHLLLRLFPSFGVRLLRWLTNVCKTSSEQLSESDFGFYTEYFWIARSQGGKPAPDAQRESHIVDRVKLGGQVRDNEISVILTARRKAAVGEIMMCLVWILAALRPRPDDVQGIYYLPLDEKHLNSGIPHAKLFEPSGSAGCCWLPLFRYAVILTLPESYVKSTDPGVEGLEIDFDSLIELSAVDREATLANGGQIFYGFDTALVPLEPIEAKRWHFIMTKGVQLTPRRVEKEIKRLDLTALVTTTDKIPERVHGRVYVGWCPDPHINLYFAPQSTRLSNRVLIENSGVPPSGTIEKCSEHSVRKAFSVPLRIGFPGTSFGLTADVRRKKKYEFITTVAEKKKGTNYEDILTCAAIIPCILWDNASEKAWLLPLVSVLAFASLRLVEAREYSFQKQEGGKRVDASISYLKDIKATTTAAAEMVLRRNRSLLIHMASGEYVPEGHSFESLVRDIWEGMCDGEDLCIDPNTGVNRDVKESILGYDLSEVMCHRNPQTRRLEVLPSMEHWKPLCSESRLHVIFTRNVGDALSCNCIMGNGTITHQPPSESGTLMCLLNDLRGFYGPNWDTAVQSNVVGLPIGGSHEWIPHNSSCCVWERQKITKIRGKKPQKHTNGLSKAVNLQFLTEQQRLLCFGDRTATR